MSALTQSHASSQPRFVPPIAPQHRPVVIVEDDDDIRESFRELLEDEGYQVLTAANGREALDVLDDLNGRPCLVLLDMMMPIMNGWQFLRALAKIEHPEAQVVVVSAVAEDTAGAVRVMQKPIDIDTLLEAVRQYS